MDISYLVADFKYSQEHGIKICEVQHGAISAVDGDLHILGENGSILPKITDFFIPFLMAKWAVGLLYPPLKSSLEAQEWIIQPSMQTLLDDPQFLECAKTPPADPSSIASYAGIVYGAIDVVRTINSHRKTYPGILFVDAATLPYWKDKYKMNSLFNRSDELKPYKADWRIYPRKYDPLLSERIQKDMPSEFYVIKPRGGILANGVIVVANTDLDSVLQMILEPLVKLKKHPDEKYVYWTKFEDDTFLIEKYYKSDYLRFSPPDSEVEYHYDATMRLAFILQYDEGKMTYQCLGGFWKLPSKGIEEEGTLNEKMISCCKRPFYMPIDPQLFEEVNAQMERAMLLLYEKMLNGRLK